MSGIHNFIWCLQYCLVPHCNGLKNAFIIHKPRRWVIWGLFRDLPHTFILFIYILTTPAHKRFILTFTWPKIKIHWFTLHAASLKLYSKDILYSYKCIVQALSQCTGGKIFCSLHGCKIQKKLLEVRHLRGEGKCLSLLTQTSASEKHSVALLLLCPKANFK